WDNTLAETGGMSSRNSLNRRGPARKCQITFGAHAPAMIAMHSVRAQGAGGGVLRFLRTLRLMIGSGYCEETGIFSNHQKLGWQEKAMVPNLPLPTTR